MKLRIFSTGYIVLVAFNTCFQMLRYVQVNVFLPIKKLVRYISVFAFTCICFFKPVYSNELNSDFFNSYSFPDFPLNAFQETECSGERYSRFLKDSSPLFDEQIELFKKAYMHSINRDMPGYLSLYIPENLDSLLANKTKERVLNGHGKYIDRERTFFLYQQNFDENFRLYQSIQRIFPELKPDVIVSIMTCDSSEERLKKNNDVPFFYGAFEYLKYIDGSWKFMMPKVVKRDVNNDQNNLSKTSPDKNKHYEFVELYPTEVEVRTSVISSRSHAYFGFNKPSIIINLPKVANSVYAQINFGRPKLFDNLDEEIKYELHNGIYDEKYFSDQIRFKSIKDNDPIYFHHATGSIHVRYPLVVTTITYIEGDNDKRRLSVAFDKESIVISGNIAAIPKWISASEVQAYDINENLLKKASGRILDGKIHLEFEGRPTSLKIDFVEKWHEFNMPFNVEIAELLPESTRGKRPKT